jgi:hypothetical protein
MSGFANSVAGTGHQTRRTVCGGYDDGGQVRKEMKEVFTKSFWEGVKKTFQEAQQDPQPPDTTPPAPVSAEPGPSASTGPEAKSPPTVS